jgi:hypothetical protein
MMDNYSFWGGFNPFPLPESRHVEPRIDPMESSFLYNGRSEAELRESYPYFTAQVFDGLTNQELTKIGKGRISRRTVFNRLRAEKEAFLSETANAG